MTYYAARIEENVPERRRAHIIKSADTYTGALKIAYMAAADYVVNTSILFREPIDLLSQTSRESRIVLRLESGIGIKNSGRVRILWTDYPKGWSIFDKCISTFGVIDDRDLVNDGYWATIFDQDGKLLVGR